MGTDEKVVAATSAPVPVASLPIEGTTSGLSTKSPRSPRSPRNILPLLPDPVFPMVDADRYAWDQTLRERRSPEEIARDEGKEEERTAKWVEMLKDWEAFFGRRPRKVKERVKKGIPDALRGRAWDAMLGADPLPEEISLQVYYDQGVPAEDDRIRADVPRMLPMVPVFQSEAKQISLYRVLRAYVNCDREMGYVQGVGFHAGILLCYLDEDRAFRALYQLFMSRGTRDLFREGFHGLRRTLACFNTLLGKRVPRVLKHLQECDVRTTQFAPAWFLTAFIAADLPIWVTMRIFDCFVLFGVRALVSFALAICKCEEERLIATASNVLPTVFQSPGQHMQCMGRPYDVITEWLRQWLTDDEWAAELRLLDRE